jgi:hypothetical protein
MYIESRKRKQKALPMRAKRGVAVQEGLNTIGGRKSSEGSDHTATAKNHPHGEIWIDKSSRGEEVVNTRKQKIAPRYLSSHKKKKSSTLTLVLGPASYLHIKSDTAESSGRNH